jgi:hypothetical protein
MWNPAKHSDEENLKWSWLRAVEWGRWPIFVSQIYAPILLLFLPWLAVVIAVVLSNILWAIFIRYHHVSVGAASTAAVLTRLKWVVCPIAAIFLLVSGNIANAFFALFWPLVIFIIGVVPTVQVGKIQKMFMAQLGYDLRTPPATAAPASEPFAPTAQETRTPEAPAHEMQMGNYYLGQNITGLAGLTEISSAEYAVLPKTFPREKIFRAADLTFLGYPWNFLVGAIDGNIYKLSAQFMSGVPDMAAAAFSDSVTYCSNQFGKPSVTQGKLQTIAKWHTSFGNIIVDTGSALGQHYVNFQVTSGSLVRSAESPRSVVRALLDWVKAKRRLANLSGSPPPIPEWAIPASPPPIPESMTADDTVTTQSARPQRTPKVTTCIRTIESELLKRTLSDQEENDVAELCGALLSMALGDEKIVVRLVKLEWTESTDVVDAFRRAQDRWERDHNRFA